MTVTFDGNDLSTRKEAHETIAKALDFPDYYGKNLDALYDVLTDIEADVTLFHADKVYTKGLIETFEDAAKENRRFTFRICHSCENNAENDVNSGKRA